MYHIFFKEQGGREGLADEWGHRFKMGTWLCLLCTQASVGLLRGEENQLTIHTESLKELRVRRRLRTVHFLWPEHWQPFLGCFLLKHKNWRDRIFSVFFFFFWMESQWKELHGVMRPFSWAGGRFMPCCVFHICYPRDRCIPKTDAFVFPRETFVSWFSFFWWPEPKYMLQLILHELEF